MVILFEENETEFAGLGLGVLKDVISCTVQEKLNEEFTLEMAYPVTGNHFKELRINRIIYCKSNPYSESMQPFRIYSITKPIDGTVTVNANHISYDMNGIPVAAIDGKNLQDSLSQIQNKAISEHNFVLNSELTSAKSFKTTAPYNMRALIMGSDEALLKTYDAEVEFDKFVINIKSKRGHDRGAKVVYASNMTDLNHETNDELLYNGVFPYYHTEETSTETEVDAGEFTKAYIVGSKPFQKNWLSYTENGEAFTPVDGASPVQIQTEGDYNEKVFVWNEARGVYVEKIYNEQVTLIEGVTNPTWISIDWSAFPKVVCRAAKKGYFKKMTDEDWGDEKGVGDVIFEGNLLSFGVTGMISENMIIYFAEVIPSSNDKENEEVTKVVDVQLDDKIIWLNTTDATNMKHNRILSLDLTQEFDEEPTKEKLRAKAEEYISKNKIGTVRHSTTVSFIDLSKTTEGRSYENFDKIELGDTVQVKYEDLGIDLSLRVITTNYDVVKDAYDNVELGEKQDELSGNSIQTGDNISSLTNDAAYADITTVNKLIAKTVTAEYLEAVNAKLSKAQVKQLEAERINVSGIIEATQFTLDKLVANMLIAENAEIAKTLTAGQIKVKGDIDVTSGAITITNDKEGTTFIVDRNGNLTANSVKITGGTLNINNGVFEVENDGTMHATNANIEGTIKSTKGEIGGFEIDDNSLHNGKFGSGIYFSTGYESALHQLTDDDEIRKWAITVNNKFGVTVDGILYAKAAVIYDGGVIAGFTIGSDALYNEDDFGYVYLGTKAIKLGGNYAYPVFEVTKDGKMTIRKGKINLGSEELFVEKKVTVLESEESEYVEGLNYYNGKLYEYENLFGEEILKELEFIEIEGEPKDWDPKVIYLSSLHNKAWYCEYSEDSKFSVSEEGLLKSKSADIGDGIFIVNAEDGIVTFAGFTAEKEKLEYQDPQDVTKYVHLGTDSIQLGRISKISDPNFSVDSQGKLKTKDTEITGELKAGYNSKEEKYNFIISSIGEMKVGYNSNIFGTSYNLEVLNDGTMNIGGVSQEGEGKPLVNINKDNANFFYGLVGYYDADPSEEGTRIEPYYDYACTIDKSKGIKILKGDVSLGLKSASDILEEQSITKILTSSNLNILNVNYDKSETPGVPHVNQFNINKIKKANPKTYIATEYSTKVIIVDNVKGVVNDSIYLVRKFIDKLTSVNVNVVETHSEMKDIGTYYIIDEDKLYKKTNTEEIVLKENASQQTFENEDDLFNHLQELSSGYYLMNDFTYVWFVDENGLHTFADNLLINLKGQQRSRTFESEEDVTNHLEELSESGYYLKTDFTYTWYVVVENENVMYEKGYNYIDNKFIYFDGDNAKVLVRDSDYILVAELPENPEIDTLYVIGQDYNYAVKCTEYNLVNGYNYIMKKSVLTLIYKTDNVAVELKLGQDYEITDTIPTYEQYSRAESGYIYLIETTNTSGEKEYNTIYQYEYTELYSPSTGYNYNARIDEMFYYENGKKTVLELDKDYFIVNSRPESFDVGKRYVVVNSELGSVYTTIYIGKKESSGFKFKADNEGNVFANAIYIGNPTQSVDELNEDPKYEEMYPFACYIKNGIPAFKIGGFTIDMTSISYGLDNIEDTKYAPVLISNLGSTGHYPIAGFDVPGWLAIFGDGFGVRKEPKDDGTGDYKCKIYADDIYLGEGTINKVLTIQQNGMIVGDNYRIEKGSFIAGINRFTTEGVKFDEVSSGSIFVNNNKVVTFSETAVRTGTRNITVEATKYKSGQTTIYIGGGIQYKDTYSWKFQLIASDKRDDYDSNYTILVNSSYDNKPESNNINLTIPRGEYSSNEYSIKVGWYGDLSNLQIIYPNKTDPKTKDEYDAGERIVVQESWVIDSEEVVLESLFNSDIIPSVHNKFSLGNVYKKWKLITSEKCISSNMVTSLPLGLSKEYLKQIFLLENQNNDKLIEVNDKTNEEFLNVNEFIGALTNTIKFMKDEITSLKNEIKLLKEAK